MRNMLRNMRLKYRMILGGVAAVVIPFSIAGIIIYVQLSNSLFEMAQEKTVHMAQDVSDFIGATLNQEIKLASAIASDPDIIDAVVSGDYQMAQTELKAIHERIGTKNSNVFLADQRGLVRADAAFNNQIGLDISDRDYFLQAKKGVASVVGPIIAKGNATPGKPIIVVCAPVLKNGEFSGIIALPLNIDFVLNMISEERLGDHGYAYLLNGEGLVLAHPRENFILNLRLFDRPGMKKLERMVLSGRTGVTSYSFDGSERIAGVAPIPLAGWTAVFAEKKDEIVAPVNRLLLTILISAILCLLVIILFIVIFSNKLGTPVQKSMDMMKQITRHSKEVFLQVGLDRKITFANPAYVKITGLTDEEIIGKAAQSRKPE